MSSEKIFMDFDQNDYIIRLSPFLNKKGEWTGEIMVGTCTTDDNTLSDFDNAQLMKLSHMMCASLPVMEEDAAVRRLLENEVEKNIDDALEEEEVKPAIEVAGVSDNVISVLFNSKGDKDG
tara:strand:- start:702 stop:1064 length:363 start_codon:yes stop_codon:yes gene_type:complete